MYCHGPVKWFPLFTDGIDIISKAAAVEVISNKYFKTCLPVSQSDLSKFRILRTLRIGIKVLAMKIWDIGCVVK